MGRVKVLGLVVPLLVAALLSMASSLHQGGEVVVIRPNSGEVTITQDQRVSARLYRSGWLSCSPGLDLDYRNAAVTYMELWRDGLLLQTIEKQDGSWNTSASGPDTLCVHVNSPYLSNWYFDRLMLHVPGDYELRWTRGWSADLTDGFDYSPADGYPDLYPATSEDFVVTIHVLPAGGN